MKILPSPLNHDRPAGWFACIMMVLLVPVLAQADLLKLESGDVLTGSYIGTVEGDIIFESSLMGRIRVDSSRSEVVTESSSRTANPTAWIEPIVDESQAPQTAASSPTKPAETEAQQEVAMPERSIWQAFWKDWKQDVRFGYTWESSSLRSEDLSIRYRAEKKWATGSLFFDGLYEYGSWKRDGQAKEIIRDRWQASGRFRSDLANKKFFLQADARFKRDNIKGIAREFRPNVGIGWRVFNTERFRLNLLPQVTVNYLKLFDSDPGWETLLTFKEDMRFKINERAVFLQSGEISWDPDDWGRSSYAFKFHLENKVTESLFINLGYELEFDYQVSAGFEEKTERTVVLMGVEF